MQPSSSRSTTYNTVVAPPVVVAPPMIGGYGFGGFGFGFAPTFFMPIGFGFGGIIQFFLIMAVFSAVAGFIRGAMAARNNGSSVDSKDDWGQL